jgi:hypothetical protein
LAKRPSSSEVVHPEKNALKQAEPTVQSFVSGVRNQLTANWPPAQIRAEPHL